MHARFNSAMEVDVLPLNKQLQERFASAIIFNIRGLCLR